MTDFAVECLSAAALLARREAVLEEKKMAIADIASSLVEAPEDNVSFPLLPHSALQSLPI